MSRRNYRKIFQTFFITLALPLLADQAHGSAVRITTWSLQSGENVTNGVAGSEALSRAAETLRKLDADVIILENVRDRETCQALADALKPENYQIAACSSFRYGSDEKKNRRQVAILSKTRALLGWSEAWQTGGKVQPLPGGFAFAEIHQDGKNTVFLVAHLGLDETNSDQAPIQQARTMAADQLLKTVETFRGWKSNQIDTVVLAGDLQSSSDARSDAALAFSGLVNSGFLMALDWLPEQNPALVNYIFTHDAGPVANVLFSQMESSSVQPVTCDLSLDPPKLAVAKSKTATASKAVVRAVASAARAKVSVPSNSVIQASPVHNETAVSTPEIRKSQPTTAVARVSSGLKAIVVQPVDDRLSYWRLGEIFAIGMLVFVIAWRCLFPRRTPGAGSGLMTREANPGVALAQNLSAEERAGVVAHLTLWLQQKFVHRLVTDRKQLMATQQAAARAVLAMDERLTNVEKQIKQRNEEYELRIEELLKELAVAREENRELIRAKIELLKLEIAKNSGKTTGFPSRN